MEQALRASNPCGEKSENSCGEESESRFQFVRMLYGGLSTRYYNESDSWQYPLTISVLVAKVKGAVMGLKFLVKATKGLEGFSEAHGAFAAAVKAITSFLELDLKVVHYPKTSDGDRLYARDFVYCCDVDKVVGEALRLGGLAIAKKLAT